jgi:predicted ATP-dependent serine protease
MKQVDLKQYQGEDKIITSYEMQEIVKNQKHLFKVKSKIPALDRLIDGFVPGELIVISGLTKNGKSLFSQTLTKNFHDQQVFSLWFSFELPPQRFLSCFDDLPLIYMPKILKAANLDWLEQRILESLQKYRTRIVFADHVHYLLDLARTRNPSIDIGALVRRLKLLAIRENLIIFLMCHTNKSKEGFGEIRDSSFIEQESDAAFMIKRFPDIADNVACLQVNQHRRTGVMKKKVWLEKINGFLVETEAKKEPETSEINRYWDR